MGQRVAAELGARVAPAAGSDTLRVEIVEGEFQEACEVCGVRPTAVVVRAWEQDFEALEKTGETGPVERFAFCPEHEGAADAFFHQLASA